MAVSGSWRIYGSVTGLPSGTRAVDVSIPVGTGVDATNTYSAINGFQALTVPTGTTAVLIIPVAGNTQTLTLKGVTGDTGIAIDKLNPTVVSLGVGASNIGITTGGSTGFTVVWM